MDLKQVIAAMKRQQGDLTQAQYAAWMDVSPQYLCDIYKGKRAPGPKILGCLGIIQRAEYSETKSKGKK
jgi:DNA-binding XRE family transcriptional regulator